jgi:biotin operon repressor
MAAVRWQNLVGESLAPEVAESFERWHVGVVRVQRFIQPEDGSPMWREDELEGRLDERLKRTVVEHGIGLVVIDPWATFYSGAENSNDEVEAAIGELRLLAEQTGTAIVIVHHLGKSQQGRDPEDLWRGASRLADAAATRVTLSPWYSAKQAEDEGILPEEARRYVFVRFLRREAPTPGFVAYLNHDGWWVRPARLPPRHDDKGQSRWCSVEDVVTALSVDGGRWDSIAQAAESLGISREAASKAMAKAKATGFVNETKGARGARRFFLAEHSESSS